VAFLAAEVHDGGVEDGFSVDGDEMGVLLED